VGYIERCVNSILSQTFDVNTLEVLLLNDGSSDGSLKIIKRLSKDHPKVIKALTHKNMGSAGTRNKGIKLSTGKYLMFVDADDWLDPDYCETFYNAIESTKSDIVIGGMKKINDSKIIEARYLDPKGIYSKYMNMAPWSKIYRADFIKSHNIEYYGGSIMDDVAFCVQANISTDKISIIRYSGYYWYDNSQGVSNTDFKKFKNMIKLCAGWMDYIFPQISQDDEVSKYFIIKQNMFVLLASGNTVDVTTFADGATKTFNWLDANYKNWRSNKYLKTKPSGEGTKQWLQIKLFLWFYGAGLLRLFAKIYCRGKDK
jgi:glycosyltransferase involved in cell wall biosynthesis